MPRAEPACYLSYASDNILYQMVWRLRMVREFLIAMTAAVAAGLVLAGLTWLASRTPSIRQGLVSRPWAIAGLVGFAAATLSLVAVLVIINLSYKAPEIKIDVVADSIPAGAQKYLTSAADDKICVFNEIHKNRGAPDAGSTVIIRTKDHWEASAADIMGSSVTCYKISISR